MSIGTFMLTKNESAWIAAHVLRVLPHVDDLVFYDGGSTDGTLEILDAIRRKEKDGGKVRVFTDKDPKNLEDDYVLLFNQAMRELRTDLAWFHHPDMWVENPEKIALARESEAIALSVGMRSFAGEPDGQLYEIVNGRADAWKNIYRLRNPDLGAHYFGHYGAANEDVYFREITGDEHKHYGSDFHLYPYTVEDSGIRCLHFSDVRTPRRRYERMVKCLLNQGHSPERAREIGAVHPRVTLKDGGGFKFVPAEYPAEFLAARAKYKHLERSLTSV